MENAPVQPTTTPSGLNNSNPNVTMPPTPQQPNETKSPFRMSLVLITGVVFLAIAGFTGYLYLSNQNEIDNAGENQQASDNQPVSQVSQSSQGFSLDPSVVCARFEDLELALQYPEKACVLDLSGKGLSELPTEITQLTNITELNLENNEFNSIPVEVFQLTKLANLNISNNNISTIPAEINSLVSLQRLDVSSNDLRTISSDISLPTLSIFITEGNDNLPQSEIDKVALSDFDIAGGQGLTQEEYEEAVRTNGESLRNRNSSN